MIRSNFSVAILTIIIFFYSGTDLFSEYFINLSAWMKISELLQPLHQKQDTVRPGEWRHVHPEKGQSFVDFLKFGHIVPGLRRRTIYVVPLGDFTVAQKKVL
ncbi:hypothetical protein ACFL35_18165, partial [Candidatus Riflebacteria bacterium]